VRDPYEAFEFIRVEVRERIAVTTMLLPEGPAYEDPTAHPMHAELRDIFAPLSADPAVDAVVLTGTGSNFFSGASLEHTRDMLVGHFDAGVRGQLETRQIISRLLDFDKPLVAAVNGAAIGPGVVLSFLADFVVASTDARFQDTHIRIGLPAGDGGTLLWPLLVGMQRARSLLLRGKPITAQEALELGLVTEVVEIGELLPQALRLAAQLRDFPSFAYRTTKLALNQWFRMSSLFTLDLALGMEVAAFQSPEFRTAIDGALETQRTRRASDG
jgi:enoyl-CoA hydratase